MFGFIDLDSISPKQYLVVLDDPYRFSIVLCVCVFLCLQSLCVYTMSSQLNANASHNNNMNPVVVNKGKFTFRVDKNETRRVIMHRLKNDWKCLQGDVSIDHIRREWYKVEFCYEEDIRYVLETDLGLYKDRSLL
ncbi:unnamed protein product [Prunus brigantina]